MERTEIIRKSHAAAESPQKQAAAQTTLSDSKINDSARMVSQRRHIDHLLGKTKSGVIDDAATPRQAKKMDAAATNRTGLPDALKHGVESLSGMSLNNVKVHYNSSLPAQLQAHAYAQGNDIHVAPGQEKHLPHEAWHVVQQAQGRVKPTVRAAGAPINDDPALEREADHMGARAIQRVANHDNVPSMPAATSGANAPVQRQIRVQNIDYDPVAGVFRQGTINEAGFYARLRDLLNAAPFEQGHRNIRQNVCQAVQQNHDFELPDIDQLASAIAGQVTQRYNTSGRPIGTPNMQQALVRGIQQALADNIQANHAVDMDVGEGQAYDILRHRPGVVMSRAKGVPNQIDYANLPGNVRSDLNTRLAELRDERSGLSAAALTTQDCFPGTFAAGVCARQRELHYQGNHTNNAGWLAHVAVPNDAVSMAIDAMIHAASQGLREVLEDPNGLARLNEGTNEASGWRAELRTLRNNHFQFNDAQVRDAALAALCQGVSAYIEFSLSTSISRMMYDVDKHRVYLTAHYKWRDGFNPFFQVNGFPAI